MVGHPDGSIVLREQADGADADKLGRQVAQTLLQRGADKILTEVYAQEVVVPRQP
jgi:hydroxymethylbilane synthase